MYFPLSLRPLATWRVSGLTPSGPYKETSGIRSRMSVRIAVVVGGDFIPLARFGLETEVVKVVLEVQGPNKSLPGGQVR